MRFYFLSFFLLWTATNIQGQYDEAIPWTPQQRLTWADFRGEPQNSRAAATTASGISYQFSTSYNGGRMELEYTVSTYFYPNRSWYHPKICDEVILSHEQLHFDISELFARRMRRIMAKTTFTNNIKAEVKSIYRQILKELAEFQNRYDQETNFSRDREKQLLWNKKIAEALED